MHLHPDFVCFPKCFASRSLKPAGAARQKRKGSSGREGSPSGLGGRCDDTWRLIWKDMFSSIFVGVSGFHGSFQLIELYVIFHVIYIYIYIFIFIYCLVFVYCFRFSTCFLCDVLVFPMFSHNDPNTYMIQIYCTYSNVICPYVVISINNIPKTPWIFRTPPQKVTLPPNHGSGKWVPSILVSFHLRSFSTSIIMGERVRAFFCFIASSVKKFAFFVRWTDRNLAPSRRCESLGYPWTNGESTRFPLKETRWGNTGTPVIRTWEGR